MNQWKRMVLCIISTHLMMFNVHNTFWNDIFALFISLIFFICSLSFSIAATAEIAMQRNPFNWTKRTGWVEYRLKSITKKNWIHFYFFSFAKSYTFILTDFNSNFDLTVCPFLLYVLFIVRTKHYQSLSGEVFQIFSLLFSFRYYYYFSDRSIWMQSIF